MEREFRVKDIINLVLDRLRQEGLYFATKDDQGYASAKSLYKLDKEGLLEEKTIDKIVEEVISYIGDGAVFMIDAVNQWIEDGIAEGKLGYVDTLNMEFDDNGIINGNLSIYNQIGQEELNVDIEPKEEEIAQEAEKEEAKKKKKTESKLVETEEYNTEEEIKGRLKEINKQLAYIRRRDNVSLAIGSEDEQSELYAERNKLNGKLRKIRNKKVDINSMSTEEQETFKNKLKKLDLWDGTEENLPSAIQLYRAYHMNESKKVTEGVEAIMDKYMKRIKDVAETFNYTSGLEEIKSISEEIDNDDTLDNTDKKWLYDHIINPTLKQRFNVDKKTEGFFKGPEVKASELKIGDTYIDMRGDLNKVLDRPMPEKDLGTVRKQLTKMLMPNQQDIKGTEWKLDRIRRATDDDFEKYPHIVDESKKVTENYKVTNIEWDTEDSGETVDAEELGLPKEVEIPAHIEEDDIADYLSDKYEYCVLNFDIDKENKKVEAKVDGAVTDIPNELLQQDTVPEFSKRDWNIYYNRCKKDYTDVYNGDSTTKISFLQNKAKQLGLGNLEFSDNSWKEDIDSVAKAYADSKKDQYNKVNKIQETRTHMQLQKGDKFVNEKGVEIEIIDVDKEHLLDGQPQVTYRFSGNTTNKDSYCYKMDSVVSTINQNRYKKVEEKKTLQEGKRQRLNEENSKSKDLINSMVTARDFDSDSPQGQIILRTQELFNVLSDRGYDVQVTFDNGESQSVIMLGNQGGSILITITSTNQPLRAFTSGNFEITDDSIQILNDIKEQITAL